jgi:hypothetical protein
MKMSSFIPSFKINGAPVEWNRQGKSDNSQKNLSQCHFVHHKSHMDLTWDRTLASVVRGRRLTAWAMARPTYICLEGILFIIIIIIISLWARCTSKMQKTLLSNLASNVFTQHFFYSDFVSIGATAPRGPRPPHYQGFTITLRHTTLGRTPLYEWSARRRDLYLTTHNTHNRQTSIPPAGFFFLPVRGFSPLIHFCTV